MWRERIRSAITTRRLLLIVVGLWCIANGLAYFQDSTAPGEPPPRLVYLDSLIPLWLYSIAWLLVGVGMIVAVWWTRTTRLAVLGAIAMQVIWATSLILASILGQAPRAWFLGIDYLVIAVLTLSVSWLIPLRTALTEREDDS